MQYAPSLLAAGSDDVPDNVLREAGGSEHHSLYANPRRIHRKNSPFYGPERFTYEPESNSYRCPAGQQLNYGGRSMRNRTYAYIGTRKKCGGCGLKAQCTSGAFRSLAIHMNEPARQRARELANTPEFAQAQRERKKVEALFAELKNQIGLRRLRLRRLRFVRSSSFWQPWPRISAARRGSSANRPHPLWKLPLS